MNPFIPKIISLSCATSGIGVGCYYFYSSNSPKNIEELLKWNGYSLASQDNTWNAIFLENESSTKTWKENITDGTKLKKECESLFEKSISSWNKKDKDYEDATKYCVDNIKSVKARLVRKGKTDFGELKVTDDHYKITFVFNKEKDSFLSLIKKDGQNLNDLNSGYTALKEWCSNELSKNIEDDDVSVLDRVIEYCSSRKHIKVEDEIKVRKNDWKKAEETEWEKIFNRWKHTELIINAVNKSKEANEEEITRDTNPIEKGKEAFKKWCEKGLNKNLFDEGVWGLTSKSEFTQLVNVCVTNQPDVPRNSNQQELENL